MIIEIILITLFILAFLSIILEEILKVNKAKTTLFFGTLSWIILFLNSYSMQGFEHIQEQFNENILEISTLWLFLMAAMTFVAYLNKKGFIQTIIYKFLPKEIKESQLLYLIGGIAFLFSSLSDNITATMISLTLVMSLELETKKLIKFAVLIIFAVNSGGAALITGDVTTLMIYSADKVLMQDLLFLVIPSFISVMFLAFLLSHNMNKKVLIKEERREPIRKIDILFASIFSITILSIIFGSIFYKIPPLLTFLFGLSVMFLVGWGYEYKKKEELKLLEYIREIEFDALLFFLGVLLLVGMLKEIGVLSFLTQIYTILPITLANYTLGLLSSIVDNIPLTAAVLKSGIDLTQSQWITLTYSLGVGGSLLIIGSASGIIAMSKIKELTFLKYIRYTPHILTAYSIGFLGSIIISILVV